MNGALLAELYVFVLAIFVGIEVISKVPVVLHTPLMSGTNAIHGIVVVGGILVLGHATTMLEMVLGCTAVAFGAMNLSGGFFVTDRMLEMFKKKPSDKKAAADKLAAERREKDRRAGERRS
jgi:NAD(P) transhydrogenase subunit alpha